MTPESFEDFVALVVPELQRRGVYKRDYRPGTLREKLFGAGRGDLAVDPLALVVGRRHPSQAHHQPRIHPRQTRETLSNAGVADGLAAEA